MAGILKLDWNQAFDEYLLVHRPKGMHQKEFAVIKGVDAEWMSTNFTRIRNERLMEANKTRMPKLLAKSLTNIEKALEEEEDRNTPEFRGGMGVEFKAKFSLDAAKVLADRLGMSPQAMTINLQQLNQNNIISAPIFAQAAAPLMNQLLGDKE